MVGTQDAKLGDGIGMNWQPGGAWAFESGVEDVLVTRFDEAGADGEPLGESRWVVESVESIGKIAMSGPHRGLFLGDRRWLEMGFQGLQNGLDGPTFEAFLLGA